MKPRKIPMRKDIVTGEMVPKKELVRIVRTPEGDVILDPSNRANGRGAYISLSVEVAETAKKKRIFDKVFKYHDGNSSERLAEFLEINNK